MFGSKTTSEFNIWFFNVDLDLDMPINPNGMGVIIYIKRI